MKGQADDGQTICTMTIDFPLSQSIHHHGFHFAFCVVLFLSYSLLPPHVCFGGIKKIMTAMVIAVEKQMTQFNLETRTNMPFVII